jgi:hypothetical protein
MKMEAGLPISAEVAFIAAHFYEFSKENIQKIALQPLEEILGSSELRLRFEDSLFELISSLGRDYAPLLRYVHCEYLSCQGIERYVDAIGVEQIDGYVWSSISNLLRHSVGDPPPYSSRFIQRLLEFRFREGFPFSGMISYLTSCCGGNIHEKEIVDVTSSGDAWNHCYQVANFGWKDYWSTKNVPDSWICFDFKEQSVSLSDYTLKSHNERDTFFIDWVIEGSNDKSAWTTLDRRTTRDLVGSSIVKTYRSPTFPNPFFRFIRMRQTGKTSDNGDLFVLTSIEFFGWLQVTDQFERLSNGHSAFAHDDGDE